jgi:hypothetical protein
MSSRRALAILIGIILIVSGIVFFFGIPGIFEVEKTPDNVWGVILLVGGGLITFFAALNEATEFIQKLFSREREVLLRREKPYDINGPTNVQNRLNVIANVRKAWIKGVLENNLQDAVRLELDLQEIPEVLMRPNVRLRYQANSERAIPSGVSIYQIFQESGQNLLILGAPGSGKTFMMLELARDLLDEAERNVQAAVPIVLNLSSWAKERPSLADWIVDEVYLQYQLAKKVTYAWLEHDQICLLLDGLDEVAQEQRDACVEAINSFKLEYSSPMVVCSRTEDYTNLAPRLNLSRAIEILHLTEAQVEEYLSKPKLRLNGVRATLQHDRELQELATTPLFLNVITLAYRGMRTEELGKPEMKEDRRRHLFKIYIRRMFKRRPLPSDSPYNTRQAVGWLAYLGHQLTQRSQSTFFLEYLQVDWLPQMEQRLYRILMRLVIGLSIGLASVLMGVIVTELYLGLIYGLFFGLLFGLSGIPKEAPIHPVDRVYLRRPRYWELISGLVVGLCVWLFARLADSATYWEIFLMGLITGIGSIFLLFNILVAVESERRVKPNQGILRSLQNVPRYALIFGLPGGLVGLLVGHLATGLGFGLAIGLVGGLMSDAGQAVIRHYVLRWVILQGELLPPKLVSFLDAMSERLLLRRIGGGYIFIHRTLMEHFASLSEDELDVLAARIEA